jgi:hypothetical protein
MINESDMRMARLAVYNQSHKPFYKEETGQWRSLFHSDAFVVTIPSSHN